MMDVSANLGPKNEAYMIYLMPPAGGHSLYNDDKGIKVTIIFTPLPSVAPVKKRRANAKAPIVTKISYFHENFTMKDFLSKVTTILKHDDLLEMSWLYHGYEREEPNSFSVFYTVPRRVIEQVEIHENEDYMQMVQEATQKNSAEVKVFIIEQKVCFISLLFFNAQITQTQGEDDDDSASEHEEAAARKKKKVRYCHGSLVYLFSAFFSLFYYRTYLQKRKLHKRQ